MLKLFKLLTNKQKLTIIYNRNEEKKKYEFKRKKELLDKIKKEKNWAIPVAIIELIVALLFEAIFLASMLLSGTIQTEFQKVILYTLIGSITTIITNKITSDAKQKYTDYEKAAIDTCLTEIKTEKVEENVKKLTSQQKIQLLSMIKNNQDMINIASELEHLKDDGEEEFYNSILQILNNTEKYYQQENSIPPREHHNNSTSRNYRRTRKKQ